MYLTVDLASKFSAWMVTDKNRQVHSQIDSRFYTPSDFGLGIANEALAFGVETILIEDVPYGIASQFQTKPVLRLQGMLIANLIAQDPGLLDITYFINPSTWQKLFPGVARGKPEDRIEAARVAAKALGYTPPDLIAEYADTLPEGAKLLKKFTNPLAKSMTDYVDAFLMSEFLRINDGVDLSTISGCQPVII